jgi:hypothetical protein
MVDFRKVRLNWFNFEVFMLVEKIKFLQIMKFDLNQD